MTNLDDQQMSLSQRTDELVIPYFCAQHNQTKLAKIKKDGKVESTTKTSKSIENFDNNFATEGFVDLQVNGFAGVDFNKPGITPEQIDIALAELAMTGVTQFLPTLITGTEEHLTKTLAKLDKAILNSKLGPIMTIGYHIEGPFLSPIEGYAGAHNPEYMQDANLDLIAKLQEIASFPIRIITVAPENPTVLELIPKLLELGIHVSIGHSAANSEQISDAVRAGASLSTHLGNGLPQMLHKTENPIFWQLAQDELTAMFIPDGIHIPVPALKSMLRAKGLQKSIVTTDAVSAAGRNTPPGLYSLGELEIQLADDRSVRVPNSVNLAGSSVTMDQILRNLMLWFDYSIPDILILAQQNPAKVLDLSDESNQTDNHARIIEWIPSSDGPWVAKAHIGPFTIQ